MALELVDYLLEKFPSQTALYIVAITTHLENRLQYLDYHLNAYANEIDYSSLPTDFAALNGNLECLKYLHKNGCPWDEDVFDAAVTN